MPHYQNLTGLKFNKLLVVSRETILGRQNYVRWNCLCDCGNKSIVISNELTRGKTKSCGCLKREGNNKKPLGEASFTSLYNKIKCSAKKRNHEFSLSKEDVKKLTENNCFYCGSIPSSKNGANRYNGNYTYNGIDRVNNEKGYILDNIVTCCKICNIAKRNLSLEKFKEWVNKIYQNWGKND